MGELRKYNVTLNGNRTVLKLSDAELKLYPDAEPVDDAGTSEPAERKTRTAANKRRDGVETK